MNKCSTCNVREADDFDHSRPWGGVSSDCTRCFFLGHPNSWGFEQGDDTLWRMWVEDAEQAEQFPVDLVVGRSKFEVTTLTDGLLRMLAVSPGLQVKVTVAEDER